MSSDAADALASKLGERLREVSPRVTGRVLAASAGRVLARIPAARIGRCYAVHRASGPPVIAQMVGFEGEDATLLPFSSLVGIEPGASVVQTELGMRAPAAEVVLGDVIDAFGRSLHSGSAHACVGGPLDASPPTPLRRARIRQAVATGVRVVDSLLPLGRGQRVGLFAGSGVGKSTLLAQLARGTKADVVIVGLVGERGREVGEFLEDAFDAETRARTTVVVATSDEPPAMRARAAEMSTALAEDWRSRGAHCLLLIDSLTRYARALRESALVAGEPPARRGYPASVFAALPKLLERSGADDQGAITAIYTVLVEGGDMEEPVADEVRGIVDGHWVLTRALAERGHFPAIDVLASVSRVAGSVAPAAALRDAAAVRRAMSLLAQHGDAIDLGIYQRGSRPELDVAIAARTEIAEFLQQPPHEVDEPEHTQRRLAQLARELAR